MGIASIKAWQQTEDPLFVFWHRNNLLSLLLCCCGLQGLPNISHLISVAVILTKALAQRALTQFVTVLVWQKYA